MNLHLHGDAFRELVEFAADHFGYEQSHVEKDYWVCKILKELAFSKFSEITCFKGGTSLSKGYGLIYRFSEDLDIFVYSGNQASSKQSEKTLNRSVSHFIIDNNRKMYVEELSKTGGDFRKLAFSYDTHYESGGLKENLEVEIKCCTLDDKSMMYYPVQKRQIQPIVAEYLNAVENRNLIARFELKTFDVQTIDPKRTLCDKISRLTRLSYGDDYEMLVAKHIRDVYDIHCLLNNPEYVNFIQSDEFLDAMQQVTAEDGLYRNSHTHKFISKAKIFAETEETLRLPNVLLAYKKELKQLIFEANTLPLSEEIVLNFSLLRQPLLLFDNKNRNL